jgi:hypothetical protein
MKISGILAGLGAVCALAVPAAMAADNVGGTVTGDYVEARSASVYAGACHFNGELTTAGREAVIAWNIQSGTANGVKLDGLRVVALVSGGDNLANVGTERKSVIVVDEAATPAQREAVVALLKQRVGKMLGTVAAVKTAPIRFTEEGASVKVAAGNLATLDITRYPCKHCMMPAETWYTPFAPTKDVVVAQGLSTGFKDKTLGVSWSSASQDNVFVGTFAL